MKLPSLRRVFSSDFPAEFKQFTDQLGILFNSNLEALYNALNNNLTFEDNFNATVINVNVSVSSTGVPNQTTSFKLAPNQKTVSGVFVINAFGTNDNSILPNAAPFVSVVQSGNFVTIRNIRGLTPSVQYTLKLVCLP